MGNFLKISDHSWRDFVSDSQRNQSSDTFSKYIPHPSTIFQAMSNFMDRKNDSRPLSQRFLMMLFFVCVGCLAQQLKISRQYTTVKRWLDTKLGQVRT